MIMLIANSRLDSFLQFLGSLGIFIFVLVITYFVTRWVGNYQKIQLKSRNMQLIETMRVANNKYIQIVKISETYLVISVGKDRVEYLTELDEDSIKALHMPEENQTESFQEILKKLKVSKK